MNSPGWPKGFQWWGCLTLKSDIADGKIGRMKSKDGARPEDVAADTAVSARIVAGATVVADEQTLAKLDDSQRPYASIASTAKVL